MRPRFYYRALGNEIGNRPQKAQKEPKRHKNVWIPPLWFLCLLWLIFLPFGQATIRLAGVQSGASFQEDPNECCYG